MLVSVGSGELHAVAFRKVARIFFVHANAMQPSRVVSTLLAIRLFHRQKILVSVNLANRGVLSRFNSHGFASTAVAHDIATFVLPSPLPIRSCKLLTRNQHTEAMFFLIDSTNGLQFAMDRIIELAARFVVRG